MEPAVFVIQKVSRGGGKTMHGAGGGRCYDGRKDEREKRCIGVGERGEEGNAGERQEKVRDIGGKKGKEGSGRVRGSSGGGGFVLWAKANQSKADVAFACPPRQTSTNRHNDAIKKSMWSATTTAPTWSASSNSHSSSSWLGENEALQFAGAIKWTAVIAPCSRLMSQTDAAQGHNPTQKSGPASGEILLFFCAKGGKHDIFPFLRTRTSDVVASEVLVGDNSAIGKGVQGLLRAGMYPERYRRYGRQNRGQGGDDNRRRQTTGGASSRFFLPRTGPYVVDAAEWLLFLYALHPAVLVCAITANSKTVRFTSMFLTVKNGFEVDFDRQNLGFVNALFWNLL